jgi:hypothetical protein
MSRELFAKLDLIIKIEHIKGFLQNFLNNLDALDGCPRLEIGTWRHKVMRKSALGYDSIQHV